MMLMANRPTPESGQSGPDDGCWRDLFIDQLENVGSQTRQIFSKKEEHLPKADAQMSGRLEISWRRF